MSAPSMMSSAWPASAARARASCGFWCASLSRSLTMARLAARSSLTSTSAARRCSFSIVASRANPKASRAITTISANAAANAKASPRKPRLSLRANRSSIRLTIPSPSPSSTSPPMAAQNSVPQRKPRRTGSGGTSIGTGNCAGSASGVICTVPRAGRLESSGSITTTPGSSSLNVAGRRWGVFSLIAVCLRSGTGGRGQGGCEAKPARRRPRAAIAAAGSAGSDSRPFRKPCWRGRETNP